MKFLVDTQLPPLLVEVLAAKQIDIIHTTFFSNGHLLQDNQIVKLATEQNRIIITKDKDFFENYLIKGVPPKILMLQFGNIKNNDLLNFFRANITTIIELFNNSAELIIFSQNQIIEYNRNAN